jgi:predicted dehydrogenase
LAAPLRIGLVGANPNRSWALLSHLPAIEKLDDVRLTAVATSNEESARQAAAAFGVEEFYDSAARLAQSPNVDIVSVCVKVAHHAGIVRDSLAAGKHVICEWPLALSVEEAEGLRDAAAKASVHCGVGLQARMSPAARRARDLVASGGIGRPLTVSIIASTEGHGASLPSAYAYLCSAANGATMSTILTGHVLDLASFVLGDLVELQSMGTIKFPQVELTDRQGYVPRDTPDYLTVQGRFASGAMLNAELDGGRPGDRPFRMEVVGTAGTLNLTGGHPYGFQAGELFLETALPHKPLDAPAATGLTGATANVGELYARFAKDIRDGQEETPDFARAVEVHRLVAAVTRAAETGQRQKVNWSPEQAS